MNDFEPFQEPSGGMIALLVILVIWEAIWKLIALWKSARRDQLIWFICLAIFNTIGILPIIYLILNRKTENKN